MKRLVISTLSLLALSSLVTPAFAGETNFKENNRRLVAATTVTPTRITEITPFNLVSSGYQGRFSNQGIPSGGSFISQAQNNRIEAKDLVQAAIATNRLGAEKLQDRQYLRSVESLLDNLDNN